MSVAFRRESDEEHKEPKFELPIPPGPNLVTERGLALIGERIVEIEAALATAADDEAREAVRRDLRYWHTRQATAQLMPAPSDEEAAFGSRVRFRLNGVAKSIDIVGDDESDPAGGRIAFSAPLARVLIGSAEGDVLDFGGKTGAIRVDEVGPIG